MDCALIEAARSSLPVGRKGHDQRNREVLTAAGLRRL